MADLDDLAQKIKGKVQQVKGDIKTQSGDEIGGAWDKVKGNVNEKIADIKLDNDTSDR